MKHDDGSWLMGVLGFLGVMAIIACLIAVGILIGRNTGKYAGLTAEDWANIERSREKTISILMDQRNEYLFDYYCAAGKQKYGCIIDKIQ